MTSSKIPTSLKNILKAFRLYSPNIFSSECDFSLNIIILLPWIRYHIFPLKKLLYDFFSAYYLSLQCVPHTHSYSNTRHLKVTNWTKTQIFFSSPKVIFEYILEKQTFFVYFSYNFVECRHFGQPFAWRRFLLVHYCTYRGHICTDL